MDRLTRLRRESHARRLTIEPYREAGTTSALAAARNVATGTVGHYRTNRPDPDLYAFLLRTISAPDVDALPFLEAMEDAYEFHTYTEADGPALVSEGLLLIERHAEGEAVKALAAIAGGQTCARELERYLRIGRRLMYVARELAERGVDIHAVYRERKAAEGV